MGEHGEIHWGYVESVRTRSSTTRSFQVLGICCTNENEALSSSSVRAPSYLLSSADTRPVNHKMVHLVAHSPTRLVRTTLRCPPPCPRVRLVLAPGPLLAPSNSQLCRCLCLGFALQMTYTYPTCRLPAFLRTTCDHHNRAGPRRPPLVSKTSAFNTPVRRWRATGDGETLSPCSAHTASSRNSAPSCPSSAAVAAAPATKPQPIPYSSPSPSSLLLRAATPTRALRRQGPDAKSEPATLAQTRAAERPWPSADFELVSVD